MLFTYETEIDHRRFNIEVDMSWEPAEPAVGVGESFSIEMLSVEEFVIMTPHQDGDEHIRAEHVGDEGNWLLLDGMVQRMIESCSVEWRLLVEAFCEASSELAAERMI